MKHLRAYRAYLLCCIFGVGSYLLYDACIGKIYQVDEYALSIDGHTTALVKADSISCLKHTQCYARGPQQLCSDVMRQFDWIQSMDLLYLPNKKAQVKIMTHNPLCVVNSDYVLTDGVKLLSRNIFEDRWTSNLPQVRVAVFTHDNKMPVLSDSCITFLRTIITSPFLSRYYCVWEHDDKACLYDKNIVNFAIIFHPSIPPDSSIVHCCDNIKQELIERHVFDVPRTKLWIADVRFKNQIVVSQEKRRGYDTNIR